MREGSSLSDLEIDDNTCWEIGIADAFVSPFLVFVKTAFLYSLFFYKDSRDIKKKKNLNIRSCMTSQAV